MPRIYTDTNAPIDLCQACWQRYASTEEVAKQNFHRGGVGPDNRGDCWGWDEDHPEYEHYAYECDKCRRMLTECDNDPNNQGSVATIGPS